MVWPPQYGQRIVSMLTTCQEKIEAGSVFVNP
jgi:hypothetical protein